MESVEKLDQFVRTQRGRAEAWVYRHLHNREDVEEVVQTAFATAAARLETYNPDRPFLGWMRTITYRSTYKFLIERRRGLFIVPLEDAPGETLEEELFSRWEQEDQIAVIMAAVGRLDHEQQFVLLASLADEMKMSLLTQHLQCSPAAVNQRILRAKRKVQDLLEVPAERRRRPTRYANRVEDKPWRFQSSR